VADSAVGVITVRYHPISHPPAGARPGQRASSPSGTGAGPHGGGCIRNGLPVLAEHPRLRNAFSNTLRAVIGAPGGQKLIMSGIVRFTETAAGQRDGDMGSGATCGMGERWFRTTAAEP